MMLTDGTARSVGITDRLDARQSIIGGARYFIYVRKMIPGRIKEPDRTWFALASYNMGFGHIEDARIFAQMDGKNPDKWDVVREYLPLLTQEKWYSQAKRGYARGCEPVQFVDSVKLYMSMLDWVGAQGGLAATIDKLEAAKTEQPDRQLSKLLIRSAWRVWLEKAAQHRATLLRHHAAVISSR
jgi:membrane-bound lytic murein transglycosylase F